MQVVPRVGKCALGVKGGKRHTSHVIISFVRFLTGRKKIQSDWLQHITHGEKGVQAKIFATQSKPLFIYNK